MREPTPRLLGLGLGLVLLLVAGRSVEAQPGPITGYVQTVPLWSDATALTDSDLKSFNRLRLSIDQPVGPVSIGAAYEHVVTNRLGSLVSGIGIGAVPSGGEALDLQWTIADDDHVLWQHRFDRLQVGWSPVAGMEFTGDPFGLTIEGQYIIKNLVLLSAAMVIGGSVRSKKSETKESVL